MKKMLIIVKKEFKDFFISPIAYVVLGLFIVLTGLVYTSNLFQTNQANLRTFFEIFPALLIVLTATITMRSWAEEKKEGTLELITTQSFTDFQIVTAKFLSNFLFVLLAVTLTLPVPITLNILGNPDNGVIIGSYLGLIIISIAYVLIGQFVSINTNNQIISLLVTVSIMVVLYVIGEPNFLEVVPLQLRGLLEALSISSHFRSIARGVIDTRDIFYFLTLIIFFSGFLYKSYQRIKINGK